VDKLSAAWEALDKQLQNQAMTVEKWEEERDKLNVAVRIFESIGVSWVITCVVIPL
jgi:hypothetical protein